MLPEDESKCCQNCEHLRVDNFCLVKGKYILSRNIGKKRDCQFFNLRIEIPSLKIKQNEQDRLMFILFRKNREKNEIEEFITKQDSIETK